MEAEVDEHDEFREKIPGVDVFDPWKNTFIKKHTHLTMKEVSEYRTPGLMHALKVYREFKTCGLPHGGGYLDERPLVKEVLTVFDEWANRMPAWERENEKYL